MNKYEVVTRAKGSMRGFKGRTSNKGIDLSKTIGGLWKEVLSNQTLSAFDHLLVSVYDNYSYPSSEAEYDVTVGWLDVEEDVDNTVLKELPKGKYAKFEIKNSKNIHEDVYKMWKSIWEDENLPRAYTCDFELHKPKSEDLVDIDIYVSLK